MYDKPYTVRFVWTCNISLAQCSLSHLNRFLPTPTCAWGVVASIQILKAFFPSCVLFKWSLQVFVLLWTCLNVHTAAKREEITRGEAQTPVCQSKSTLNHLFYPIFIFLLPDLTIQTGWISKYGYSAAPCKVRVMWCTVSHMTHFSGSSIVTCMLVFFLKMWANCSDVIRLNHPDVFWLIHIFTCSDLCFIDRRHILIAGVSVPLAV